ncbi:MAG: AI-2E family transporter, partial [Mesorhizobium sp.]|nr:AI-2E family transporter [Mesorhizobium sp.]
MNVEKPVVVPAAPLPEPVEAWPSVRGLLLGIFGILLFYSLYFAREFFVPVVLAFLFALTLTPIVRWLRKRGIPSAVSAVLLVLVTASTLGLSGYLLSGPVTDLANDAPRIGYEVREKLSTLRGPIDRLLRISEDIESATETAADSDTQKVVLQQPGIVSRAAGNLLSAGTTIAITLVLTIFLLASGTMFYEKIIQSFSR